MLLPPLPEHEPFEELPDIIWVDEPDPHAPNPTAIDPLSNDAQYTLPQDGSPPSFPMPDASGHRVAGFVGGLLGGVSTILPLPKCKTHC